MSVGPQLRECPVCGAVGLSERIDDHDCAVASDCATQEAALILRDVDVRNHRHVGDSRGE